MPNNEHFRRHIQNIALQRGWFLDQSTVEYVRIIIPTDETAHLDDLTTSGTAWVRRHISDAPAVPPSSDDLTTVTLHLDHDNTKFYIGSLLILLDDLREADITLDHFLRPE